MFKLFNTTTESDFCYTDGNTVFYKTKGEACAAADLMNGGGVPFLFVKEVTAYTETCPRCAGKGLLPKFGHVEHGLCFLCRGSGKRGARSATIHPAFR